MRFGFVYITFLTFFIVSISCGPSKKLNSYNYTFEDINASMKSNFEKINNYSATGEVELNLQKLKMDLRFSIDAVKPKTAIINLFGPFGLDIASIYLQGDTLMVYNSINNQVIKTTLASKKFNDNKDLMFFITSFTQLLFGYLDVDNIESDSTELVEKNENLCVLKYNNDVKVDFCFNRTSMFISKIFYDKKSTDEKFEIIFEKIKQVEGIKFPMQITFNNLKSYETISLTINKINFNLSQDKIRFIFPEDAEVKEW